MPDTAKPPFNRRVHEVEERYLRGTIALYQRLIDHLQAEVDEYRRCRDEKERELMEHMRAEKPMTAKQAGGIL